jgi:hypothetical protein
VQISQAVSDEIPFELFWPMVKDDIALWLCRIGGDETGSAMSGYVWLGRLLKQQKWGFNQYVRGITPLSTKKPSILIHYLMASDG